jgi:hypothetical protein
LGGKQVSAKKLICAIRQITLNQFFVLLMKSGEGSVKVEVEPVTSEWVWVGNWQDRRDRRTEREFLWSIMSAQVIQGREDT